MEKEIDLEEILDKHSPINRNRTDTNCILDAMREAVELALDMVVPTSKEIALQCWEHIPDEVQYAVDEIKSRIK